MRHRIARALRRAANRLDPTKARTTYYANALTSNSSPVETEGWKITLYTGADPNAVANAIDTYAKRSGGVPRVPPMRAEYDAEARAIYVYLVDEPKSARTVDLGSGVIVDLDAANRPVGVEVLVPA